MSFAAPLVLLALVAVPVLGVWYAVEQRARTNAALAFSSEPLRASTAPRRPGWRRHAPYVLLALALAALIVAAARPRHAVTVPVKRATVMFANDISDSMSSTDVRPSRLVAAKRAAISFVNVTTSGIQTGSISFARHATLLQSPTRQRAQTREAIAHLAPGGGGTAIGDAIQLALSAIATAPRIDGKHPPGAVIVISDGVSNVGTSPIVAAEEARKKHVKIFTVSIGTAGGTIQLKKHGRDVTTPVPVDPSELREIAATSGGEAFRAADSATVKAVYDRLARRLGHERAQRGLTAYVAGVGLLLLCAGLGLSMRWFGRLA